MVVYYYWYVRVNSERGRISGEINHQLATTDNEELIMTESTFMFEGCLFCTLPYTSGLPTIMCTNLMKGTEQMFEVDQVCQLIHVHNRSTDDDFDDL